MIALLTILAVVLVCLAWYKLNTKTRFTIKMHTHRARPLYWLVWWPILWNPTAISRRVRFEMSARYELTGGDQEDRNKLFGLTFTRDRHDNSARFGWRWNPPTQKFILSVYCYLNGDLNMEDLCEIVPNYWYDCHILITDTHYIFRVMNESGDILCTEHISKGHKRKLAFLMGAFFGGNQTTEHDIHLQMKKI